MGKLRTYRISIILILIVIINIVYYDPNIKFIEDLDIPSGIGYDIEKKMDGIKEYLIPISTYVFVPNGPTINAIHLGKGETLLKTRQYRQRQTNRKFLLGNEKVYVFGETIAYNGLGDISNLLFFNPSTNPTGVAVVCSGKSQDILKYKVEGYPTSSDYIFGIIQNAGQYNFFPSKKYNSSYIYSKINSEGENLVLPYIEIRNTGIKICGLALFDKDKMKVKINSDDTKMANILREQKSKGIISVMKGQDDYAEVDCYVKRKVKCYKEGDKYKFIIKLKIDGDIIDYKSPKYKLNDIEAEKEIKSRLEEKINNECYAFIDKAKNVYKLDVFELGKSAAAKYGRGTGVDWNKVVSDSDIKMDIKINLIRQGRGKY